MRMHENDQLKHCMEFDAYYHVATGVWAEEACGDPDCIFCAHRPENHDGTCFCLREDDDTDQDRNFIKLRDTYREKKSD